MSEIDAIMTSRWHAGVTIDRGHKMPVELDLECESGASRDEALSLLRRQVERFLGQGGAA